MKTKEYSHIMQDTPAAVWIPRAQTFSTGSVLLTWLDGNLGNLENTLKGQCHAVAWQTSQDAQKEASGYVCVNVCALTTCIQSHTNRWLISIYFSKYI